jgi:hypothetical protein
MRSSPRFVLKKDALVLCSIAAVSLLVYLPAVNNSFMSDDFGIFPLLQAFEQNPSYIFDTTSELFRVMSYLYFWACFTLFGLNPELYYLAGIALHALISILVNCLVRRITGDWLSGWAAGLFFAAYERHQEAVMWISAANELILTLWCLVFLLLWDRAISSTGGRSVYAPAALVVFAVALFSKEAAVVLAAIAAAGLLFRGYSGREVIERSIPVFLMVAAFVALWLSQADRNFFVADGHYAFGLQAFPVYARALVRLLSAALPFVVVLFLLRRGKSESPWNSSFVFFGVLLCLAIVPYSFLTYQDHLPSRHTYFPSVGLAGLVGILFTAVYERLSSSRSKQAWCGFLLAFVLGNGAYIWLKKEPQYRERAAPTRELIQVLNAIGSRSAQLPFYVCGFPLMRPWWFGDAVSRFTPFTRDDVILSDSCVAPEQGVLLVWDPNRGGYSTEFEQDTVQPAALDASLEKIQ